MTLGDLNAALKSGAAKVEEPAAPEPSASAPAAAATPEPITPEQPSTVEQYIPQLVALQSTQKYLSAAPTFIPQTFQDQIQFVFDGTDYWLYVYINNQWKGIKVATTSAFAVGPIAGTGTTIQDANANVRNNASSTPTKVKTLTCNTAGFYNFNVNMESVSGAFQAYAKLYINGVDTRTVFTPNSSYTRLDLGAYWAVPGDVFDLYLYVLDVGHTTSQANSFQVTADLGLILTIPSQILAIATTVASPALGSPSSSDFAITTD